MWYVFFFFFFFLKKLQNFFFFFIIQIQKKNFYEGKSTLFQLLMRFYDIEKGEILIDGVDIKSMSVQQLRSLFGVVSQEPVLFMGTVSYNIKYYLIKMNFF